MTRHSDGGNGATLDRRHLLATAAAGVGTTVVPGVSSGQESSETTQAGVTSTDGPVAYVGSHLDEEFGLHAIDTETGARVWTFKESRRFSGGPTVVDGVVYSPDYTPFLTFESQLPTPEGVGLSVGLPSVALPPRKAPTPRTF
jgi:outer membrane protein assembly factor BamB